MSLEFKYENTYSLTTHLLGSRLTKLGVAELVFRAITCVIPFCICPDYILYIYKNYVNIKTNEILGIILYS